MRTLVLRLLLAAMFFNMVVGMPLHEASHLAAKTVASADVASGELSDEHAREEGGACQWCAAYARQSSALLAGVAATLLAPIKRAQPVAFALPARVPDGERWSRAARGPPRPV